MSFWMENAMAGAKTPTHILVDCGYVNHPDARRHVDLLLKHISRKNVEIVAFGRILVRIPPQKKARVFSMFDKISAGPGYSWTTHVFERGGEQFNLEYAVK